MSTITLDDDLARIDEIKRRHLLHRDPGDEHWRDIDALLHASTLHNRELADLARAGNDDLEAAFREHRHEIENLRADHKSELEISERYLADYEEQIVGLNRSLAEAGKRCDWLVEVARLFASRVSPEHRVMLDKKLAGLKPVHAIQPEAAL